jgi:hypothetical protein
MRGGNKVESSEEALGEREEECSMYLCICIGMYVSCKGKKRREKVGSKFSF